MGAGDFNDFVRSVPISFLLAPFCFAAIYIALMVIVLRRAAERRRRRREADTAQMGITPTAQSAMGGSAKASPLAYLRGQQPEQPVSDQPPQTTPWTIAAALREIPEPDLDLLANLPGPTDPPVSGRVQVEPQPLMEDTSTGPEPDWLDAVMPTAEEQPVAASAPMNFPANTPATREAAEVMRAWRDLSDGSLIIQMGNQRYRTLAEIQGAGLTHRLEALVRELNALIGGAPAQPANRMPIANNPGTMIPPAPIPSGGTNSRVGLLQVVEPERKPGLIKSMARGLRNEDSKGPQPKSVADVVEDFLQFKLSSTPEFATRHIHIRPTPDHGLRIEVDGHFYEAIPDVVDPDVREFLLNMMREWEARQ